MNRGDIWWVSFEKATGGEVHKRRPAVIISNNTANRFANRVQVVPLSSRIEKLYPCETLVDGARRWPTSLPLSANIASSRPFPL